MEEPKAELNVITDKVGDTRETREWIPGPTSFDNYEKKERITIPKGYEGEVVSTEVFRYLDPRSHTKSGLAWHLKSRRVEKTRVIPPPEPEPEPEVEREDLPRARSLGNMPFVTAWGYLAVGMFLGACAGSIAHALLTECY